jgi:endonuclease/exonuclease/phosphatase family metal-dependent hydrolase
VRVLTWNIQWGRGVDGRVDIGRVAREIERVGTPELICLQEVADGFADTELSGHDGSNQFEALASCFPRHAAAVGIAVDMPTQDGRPRRFGNMILSRCPIATIRPHMLPWPPDDQVRSMQRAALEVLLHTALGDIRLTTTHLEYYSAIQRKAQVERLLALHAEGSAHAGRPRPVSPAGGPYSAVAGSRPAILAGDFNCGPGSQERSRLVSAVDRIAPRFVDAWEVAFAGMDHPKTAGVHDRVQWNDQPVSFDTVFVTADIAPRVRGVTVNAETTASDHQPVLVELDIPC